MLPLNRKPYHSIGHIQLSQLGDKDHHIESKQEKIALTDFGTMGQSLKLKVACTLKKDGTNVAIAKINHQLVPLRRSGERAELSPYLQHHLFATWMFQPEIYNWFHTFLHEGEWVSGEWLAQAHGIIYQLKAQPFYLFDLFQNGEKVLYEQLIERFYAFEYPPCCLATILHYDFSPYSLKKALRDLALFSKQESNSYPLKREQETEEGLIWRVESHTENKVLWLCKYVNPKHQTGQYMIKNAPIWNECLSEQMTQVGINFYDFIRRSSGSLRQNNRY